MLILWIKIGLSRYVFLVFILSWCKSILLFMFWLNLLFFTFGLSKIFFFLPNTDLSLKFSRHLTGEFSHWCGPTITNLYCRSHALIKKLWRTRRKYTSGWFRASTDRFTWWWRRRSSRRARARWCSAPGWAASHPTSCSSASRTPGLPARIASCRRTSTCFGQWHDIPKEFVKNLFDILQLSPSTTSKNLQPD